MSDLLNIRSFRLFWNRFYKWGLDDSKVQSIMAIENCISGDELKSFFFLTPSFLSTFIIIICIEQCFKEMSDFWCLHYLMSFFKTFYISESESGTLNIQTGCLYLFWAAFFVSRYKVNSFNGFIIKKKTQKSFSFTLLLSWLQFSFSLCGGFERHGKCKRTCDSVPQLGNMDLSHRNLWTLPSCVWCKGLCLPCELLLEDKGRTESPTDTFSAWDQWTLPVFHKLCFVWLLKVLWMQTETELIWITITAVPIRQHATQSLLFKGEVLHLNAFPSNHLCRPKLQICPSAKSVKFVVSEHCCAPIHLKDNCELTSCIHATSTGRWKKCTPYL